MPSELDYLLHPKGALGALLASKILASPKSVRDIAGEMGTSPTGLKSWVQGTVPRPANQEKIAAWLGISRLEVARLAAGLAPADGAVMADELGVIRTEPEKTDAGRRLLTYPAWVLERLAGALEAIKEEGVAEYRRATPEADGAPDPGSTG